MISAIQSELKQRSAELKEDVDTIYFGGGTPSLLNDMEINSLISTIHKYYVVSENVEITLEANPDDLDQDKLEQLIECGINRLSIGIQSFSNDLLYQMNRSHSSQQAIEAIQFAQDSGFENISIDLMFGLPDLSDSLWMDTLAKVIKLEVQHLSCYNLTVEENTALWHHVNKNQTSIPAIQNQENQFFNAHDFLESHGFFHYEISNFSKDGFKSKHNSNYWNRTAYLGTGPSAHSFIDKTRRWNISNNTKYLQGIHSGETYSTIEYLTDKDQFNEMLMLGLRTSKGVSKSDLEPFLYYDDKEFVAKRDKLLEDKILIDNGPNLTLSKNSFFLCDFYSSELFAV